MSGPAINSGDIIPMLLRAAPLLIMVWVLILSIKAWRKKPGQNGSPVK